MHRRRSHRGRHVRHVSPISRTSDVTKNPNSPPTAQGFLSLLGECAPIGPAQQLQKLPSFYGWNLNFTTSYFLTLFLFQAVAVHAAAILGFMHLPASQGHLPALLFRNLSFQYDCPLKIDGNSHT